MDVPSSRQFPGLSSTHSLLLKFFVAILTSYLIFLLPYSFPPRTRLVSPSYVFGFNNRMAILSLVAVTLLLSVLEVMSAHSKIRSILAGRRGSLLHRDRSLLWSYVGAALGYLAITLVIYFTVAKPDGYYKLDWESSHFLWRTRLMTLYGLQPYRDFVAEYGPALVYLPTWAARIL